MSSLNTSGSGPQLLVQMPAGNDPTIVTITGEIDLATHAQLQQAVTDLLHHHPCHHLVLDMAGVTFLDAAGIRALLACHHTAEQLGTRLEIGPAGDMARRVLTLCSLADLFHLSPPASV
ncbi:STAS domain-containing protein [Krasilnikovia sp. MM14-A1259]|uniref:STAS domain-containing protein n=1 Tax=Krasilnikovia sp. MM14-A1259 TaxID=3373539 RepID=UPI00381F916A